MQGIGVELNTSVADWQQRYPGEETLITSMHIIPQDTDGHQVQISLQVEEQENSYSGYMFADSLSVCITSNRENLKA